MIFPSFSINKVKFFKDYTCIVCSKDGQVISDNYHYKNVLRCLENNFYIKENKLQDLKKQLEYKENSINDLNVLLDKEKEVSENLKNELRTIVKDYKGNINNEKEFLQRYIFKEVSKYEYERKKADNLLEIKSKLERELSILKKSKFHRIQSKLWYFKNKFKN